MADPAHAGPRRAAGDGPLSPHEETAALLAGRLDNLYRMMRAVGLDPAAAEDVVSQTCCLALERAEQFKGDGPRFAWVARIAYRQAGRRRRPSVGLPETLPDSGTAGPADVLIAREASERLQAAFDRLPVWERAALLLQSQEGWSGDQIARVLDRPAATVYSDLSRARARLRVALQPGGPA